MKKLKPYLKQHATAEEAYERTTQKNVTAVKVRTWYGEVEKPVEFYSYKTKWDGNPDTLKEDFPLALGSNQGIEEIDQFD